jgi:hypothetical protein
LFILGSFFGFREIASTTAAASREHSDAILVNNGTLYGNVAQMTGRERKFDPEADSA